MGAHRAEELPSPRPLSSVAFAASFHWMARQVARIVRTMLERDGVAVQIDAPGYRCDALADAASGLPQPFHPTTPIVELRRRYSDPTPRRQGIRNLAERRGCRVRRCRLRARPRSSSPTARPRPHDRPSCRHDLISSPTAPHRSASTRSLRARSPTLLPMPRLWLFSVRLPDKSSGSGRSSLKVDCAPNAGPGSDADCASGSGCARRASRGSRDGEADERLLVVERLDATGGDRLGVSRLMATERVVHRRIGVLPQ